MAGLFALLKRQDPINNNNNNQGGYGYGYNGYGGYGGNNEVNWWWTSTGMAVRYAIVALFFLTIIAFFTIGYIHARRRLRHGQPPLPYHRWMVRRQYYYPPQPRYRNPQDPYRQSYGMEGYPAPPPAYSSAEVPPPVYAPPPGATKAMADQSFGQTNRGAGEASGSAEAYAPGAARQAQ